MDYGLLGSSVHGILQGCHFLLQGIFLTQELKLGLLLCRQIVYRLSYEGREVLKDSLALGTTDSFPAGK